MKGWHHRIDCVPQIGRRVEFGHFTAPTDPTRFARVVAPYHDDRFRAGLGDDVRLDPEDSTGVWLIPSKAYSWWRYADQGDAKAFWPDEA